MDCWVRFLPQPRIMAVEATIFTGWIYDHLLPRAEQVMVAHPLMPGQQWVSTHNLLRDARGRVAAGKGISVVYVEAVLGKTFPAPAKPLDVDQRLSTRAAAGTPKRGGNAVRVPLDAALLEAQARGLEILALDQALESLSKIDGRKGRVVELRYFGGFKPSGRPSRSGAETTTSQHECGPRPQRGLPAPHGMDVLPPKSSVGLDLREVLVESDTNDLERCLRNWHYRC